MSSMTLPVRLLIAASAISLELCFAGLFQIPFHPTAGLASLGVGVVLLVVGTLAARTRTENRDAKTVTFSGEPTQHFVDVLGVHLTGIAIAIVGPYVSEWATAVLIALGVATFLFVAAKSAWALCPSLYLIYPLTGSVWTARTTNHESGVVVARGNPGKSLRLYMPEGGLWIQEKN
jgi:hypothetical protein